MHYPKENPLLGLYGGDPAALPQFKDSPLGMIGGQSGLVDSGNIGDNFCHDFLNRQECGYDGGDCCQVRNIFKKYTLFYSFTYYNKHRTMVELLKMDKIHAIHVFAILAILKIQNSYVYLMKDYQISLVMDIVMIVIIIQNVILMLGIVALMSILNIVQNVTVLQVCIINYTIVN